MAREGLAVILRPEMLHLGSIRGTSIDVDVSFLILIFFFVATSYNPEDGLRYALLWAPVLFISVLLHELAHAAMIGIFGYGSSQVVLGGMGGVTINARRAAPPWHDMLISAAGPLASFALFWLTQRIFYTFPYAQRDPMLAALLPRLWWANMVWGFFNLLPIAPLDGGSVVRNLLRMFLQERTAFIIAVWIGMITAPLVILWFVSIRQYFAALLMVWFLITNWQRWSYFRTHGYPG